MRFLIHAASAAVFALACLPAHADAAACGNTEKILAALAEKYSEVPKFTGMSDGGHRMIITESPSGSFTVLYGEPDGTTCIVSSGKGWSDAPAEKANPSSAPMRPDGTGWRPGGDYIRGPI